MRRAAAVLLALGACSNGAGPGPGASGAASGSGRAPASAAPSAAASASASAAKPCEAPACRRFDTPEEALRAVLAEVPDARVVALGETHAPKGSEGVTSTAKRTLALLPILEKAGARDLVIELAVADGSCGKEKEQKTKEATKEVQEKQSAGNQNEFVELAQRAKDAGIAPHILRPSCGDFDKVLAAGQDGVFVMLDTITRLMGDALEKLATGKKSMVVGYGGAMHNDVIPRPGREKWSFATRLLGKTGPGGYVEVDLIVPAFIRDNPSWRQMPWFEGYDRARDGARVTLFKTGPGAYALIFAGG